jgi:hypothetical protein
MMGKCSGDMFVLAKKVVENKRKLNENFESNSCKLCLDDGCSNPAHATQHVDVEYLVRRVTRCDDTESCEKLPLYFEERDLENIRLKGQILQSKVSECLEGLLEAGENPFDLGGSFYVFYSVKPGKSLRGGNDQQLMERDIPCTGIYQISQGTLKLRYESSDIQHISDVDPWYVNKCYEEFDRRRAEKLPWYKKIVDFFSRKKHEEMSFSKILEEGITITQ